MQNQYVVAGTQTGPPCDPSSGALDRPPRDEPYPDWAKDIWQRLNGRDQSQEERDYNRNWFESRHQSFVPGALAVTRRGKHEGRVGRWERDIDENTVKNAQISFHKTYTNAQRRTPPLST